MYILLNLIYIYIYIYFSTTSMIAGWKRQYNKNITQREYIKELLKCSETNTRASEICPNALKYYLKHGGKMSKMEYLAYYIPAGILGVYTIYAIPPKLSQINLFKRGVLLLSLPFTFYVWGIILTAEFRVNRRENIINLYLERLERK